MHARTHTHPHTLTHTDKMTCRLAGPKFRYRCFGCCFYAVVQLGSAVRARPHWPPQQQSISGLVVEYIFVIDVARSRFPADALDKCDRCSQWLGIFPCRSDPNSTAVGSDPSMWTSSTHVYVGFGFDFTGQNSATGIPTRIARSRAEYANQLDYSGF